MEKHRFKTAEFAALCGVKKDTLLHYDHIGLLKPQWVGENGYRYYSARQIPTYDLIATLRRLGTPLAEIRSYLTRRSPEALMDLLREKEALIAFCQGMQKGAPVDSFVVPEPWDMPGYDCQVIMAAGAFIAAGAFTLGASIELSADAPLREPFAAWMQGGLNFHSGRLGAMLAAQSMVDKGVLHL